MDILLILNKRDSVDNFLKMEIVIKVFLEETYLMVKVHTDGKMEVDM
jgi:hypothetical protein